MSYANVGPYNFDYSYVVTNNVAVPGSDVSCYLEFEITQALGPGIWHDPNIFMYQRELGNEAGIYNSFFSNVCTPVDLQEILTTSEPASNVATPDRFRLPYVRAYFRSRFELDQAIQDILNDIQALANGLALESRYLAEPKTGTIVSA